MTIVTKNLICSCQMSAQMRHQAWRSGFPAGGNVEVLN